MRIGVFVCHCGTNIGGMVDSHQVAEEAKRFPHVAYATDYMYTCSEPGQKEIQEAIKEHALDAFFPSRCVALGAPSDLQSIHSSFSPTPNGGFVPYFSAPRSFVFNQIGGFVFY